VLQQLDSNPLLTLVLLSVLLPPPTCTEIPEHSFAKNCFVYFMCDGDVEPGAGVIMAVVAHTKMLKVRRYAQVEKNVWKPFKRHKHHCIVSGFLVMSVVWVNFNEVLAVSLPF
jgi:hypothetical protein